MKWPMALLSAVVLFSPLTSFSAEPAFCDPATFSRFERGHNVPNLERAHVYKIGQLTLVGLGVGVSDPRSVKALASQYGVQDQKACTWYFNDGNDEASKLFNHIYVPSPVMASTHISKTYAARIGPEFTQRPLLNCAGREGYIAMGCDGMRHRGPSAFAMFLAYAGCSAANATKIANKVWGHNFVSTQTRQAIAAEGERIGTLDPKGRAFLQSMMSTSR